MTTTQDKPVLFADPMKDQGELFTREFCAGAGQTWRDPAATPDAADDAGKADS
jgi:hypothetical protein